MSTHNMFSWRTGKALLMSTHNICFDGEIRKMCSYPLVSDAMCRICHSSMKGFIHLLRVLADLVKCSKVDFSSN